MYNLQVLIPIFSENSVDQVDKEKGINRAQRLGTAKKIILAAREARSWRAYAAYLCKPVPKEANLENRCNIDAKSTLERCRAEKEKTIRSREAERL